MLFRSTVPNQVSKKLRNNPSRVQKILHSARRKVKSLFGITLVVDDEEIEVRGPY